MSQQSKLMSRHKTKFKAEELCRDIEIVYGDIKKLQKEEIVLRLKPKMLRQT